MFTSNKFITHKWLLVSLLIVTGKMVTVELANAGPDNATGSVGQSQVDNNDASNTVDLVINPNTNSLGGSNLGAVGNEITLSPDVLQSLLDLGDGIGANTITGDVNTLGSDSSNTITICFSEPCVPSGESTRAITLNELAELIESDLQNSLNELAAAEALEQRASERPRTFVRRRSTNCVNPAIQARQTLERKLEESQKFVEQIEQFNPEKNIW